MLGKIAYVIVWLLFGIITSVAIGWAAGAYVNAQVPVKPRGGGTVYTDAWDRGYVSTDGTWVIENERSAYPIQVTNIACYRDENECQLATAELFMGDVLTVGRERFNVVRWTNDMIIFTNSLPPLCVTYTYTISRVSKRVVGVRNPTADADAVLCNDVGKQPLQLTLSDGWQVFVRLRDEAWSRAQPFMWGGLTALWIFVVSRLFWRPKRRHTADPMVA